MKNEEQIIQIQELIEQFDFAELDEKQRELVIEHSSEKQYNEMRNALQETVAYFEHEPNIELDDFVKPKMTRIRQILTYRIPVYQAASIALIVALSTIVSSNIIDSGYNNFAEGIRDQSHDTAQIGYADSTFIKEIEQMKKYTSKNSIKYSSGM